MTRILTAVLILSVAAPLACGPPESRRDELFGIYLGMSHEDAERHLGEIATLDVETREGKPGAKQTWNLRDPHYATLGLRYGSEHQVIWATAFARPENRPRYSDIGPLDQARLQGNYFYTWIIPAEGHRVAVRLVARGTDPEYLDSVSINPAEGE